MHASPLELRPSINNRKRDVSPKLNPFPHKRRYAMDGQTCDRHSSAMAKARLLLPSLNVLYLCAHCAHTLPLSGEYHITYETVEVGA